MTSIQLYNCADDNTLAISNSDHNTILRSLSRKMLSVDTENAIQRFNNNGMKANPEKFHVMFINPVKNNDPFPQSITVKDINIARRGDVRILGVTFDKELNFNKHIHTPPS